MLSQTKVVAAPVLVAATVPQFTAGRAKRLEHPVVAAGAKVVTKSSIPIVARFRTVFLRLFIGHLRELRRVG